ncbi:MAG: hypothetical protein HQK96_01590 [Nitrospirae bacterium]|nr:hypothetical protein [Nitrospirota bacterium]
MNFQTEHKLDFEVASWPNIFCEKIPFHRFRIGTCNGLWRQNGDSYEILAIENTKPNNGHFKDVLQWFWHSCKRDKLNLKILELWNERFKKHLIEKHGFEEMKGGVIWRRKCKKSKHARM